MKPEKIRDELEKFALKYGYKMTDVERKTLKRTFTTLSSFIYPEFRKNIISKRRFEQITKGFGILGIDFESYGEHYGEQENEKND